MPDDTPLTSLEALREIYPPPKGRPAEKTLTKLDKHCRDFIALSPFLVLGTVGDTSPKGDEPGFVTVLDDTTLLLPDRKGNNRIDSFQNIVEDPRVSLIFFIPGVNETLRVNGRAEIIADPDVLEPLSFKGSPPVTALKVHLEEAFLHCAKAMIRSKLWDPDHHVDRKALTPAGRMLADQIGQNPDEGQASYDEAIRTSMEDEGRV